MRIVAAALLVAACDTRGHHEVEREPPHQRRVIEPPSASVAMRPPHAIHADSVGPYKLGVPLESVRVPSGLSRPVQFDIPNVVHQSVLRADETVLIGGEPRGQVAFIAVVGSDVAKTESGIHVGSTREDFIKALGPPLDDPDRARDPHLIVPASMPTLRALIAGETIAAFVLEPEPKTTKHASDCTRPASHDDAFGACLDKGELVTTDGDELIVRVDDKTIGTQRWPGLVWAGALRDGDRDDLVAVYRTDDAQQRTWLLRAWRIEAGKLVTATDKTDLYQLTSQNVRWIGAELADVELFVELTSHGDTIEVGGLLTTRVGDRLRDVLAISPVSVPRKRGKPAFGEASDAGVPPEPPDAPTSNRRSP